jgi:ribosomal protein S8
MAFRNLQTQRLKTQQKTPQPIFSVKTFFRAYIGAIKSKALYFNFPFSTSKVTYDFLNCLEKESRIAGYTFSPKDQNVKIFLSYDLTQSKPLIPKVTYYSSQGRTRIATVKTLQQFQMQNPHSLTLIGTAMGIMDLKSCLVHNCGGEFLISLT